MFARRRLIKIFQTALSNERLNACFQVVEKQMSDGELGPKGRKCTRRA